MSHFTTLVIGEDPEALLAPFDEGIKVEPYRRYEDGKPADHWWVRSVRAGAEHHRDGTGLKPYNPRMLGAYSSSEARETPDEQRAGFAEDAEWAAKLGDAPDWQTVVRLLGEKYPGDEIDRLYYDAETDGAYNLSTYNPKSKWDWYQLGGRWTGFFALREGAEGEVGKPGAFDEEPRPRWVDRVRKADIDFALMMGHAEAEAISEHTKVRSILAGIKTPLRWEHVREEMFPGDIQGARRFYGAQDAIRALRDAGVYADDPADDYCLDATDPQGSYVERAIRQVGIPFAILTTHGWAERGRMGWWGMVADENTDWVDAARQIIDSAPDSALFSLYDLHI